MSNAAWRTKVRFGETGEITLKIPALTGHLRQTSDFASAFSTAAIRGECERPKGPIHTVRDIATTQLHVFIGSIG